MSNSDNKDGGDVLPFIPRVVLPGSLDAPGPDPAPEPDVDDGPAEVSVPVPRLPAVAQMGPPLHLTVPGTPVPEPEPGEEVDFSPPPPEDPDNPTARDTLATAMALVTALGVAAAQGMWHRARQRQALADQSRAAADKATAKAAAGPGGTRGAGGSTGGKASSAPSALRSLGGASPKTSRSADGGASRQSRAGKAASGPQGGADSKAPKADRGGKRVWKDRDNPRRRKDKKDKPGRRKDGASGGGIGRWMRRRTDAVETGSKKGTKPKGRKGGPGKDAQGPKRPGGAGRTLRWKAPKNRPGPGGGKAIAERKRWAGRTAPGGGKSGSPGGKGKQGAGGKGTPSAKRSRRPWGTRTWKSTPGWMKRRRTRHKAEETSATNSAGTPDSSGSHHAGDRESWARSTPPPPPPGWERMRPPPGFDRTVTVTVEQVDERPWPRPEPMALTVGQAALPPGPAASPTVRPAPSPPSVPDPQGDQPVSTPAVKTTQYADAELTVHDVIDADADMAEEITDGVSEAQATADGCEVLLSRLEELHAKVVELKVPGVLEGMVLRLIDKTLDVRGRARAIGAHLPMAAEAIAVAGSNAEARHEGLADRVRDMGHIRPAEREYHG